MSKAPTVKPHHPLMELLGQKLSGIEGDWPLEYKRKMVNDAIKAAVQWHEAEAEEARQRGEKE